MKRIALIGTMLMAFSSTAFAQGAVEWALDGSHSNVGFSVKHMMVSNVRGRFEKFDGKMMMDPAKMTEAQLEISIDAASINTRDTKRDDHLRNPDFFDVQKFPKITFKSKQIKKAGKGFKVMGDLTIRDVTKPVTLTVKEMSPVITDPWGNQRFGATATTTINRNDFNVKWSKTMDKGGLVVGNDVEIVLDVEFIQKKQ